MDFKTFNEMFASIEVSTLDAWIAVYNGFVEVQDEMSQTAYGKAWHEAGGRYAPASVVSNLGYVRQGVDKGWIANGKASDWSTLVHLCNPNQGKGRKAAEQTPDKVAKRVIAEVNALSTRDAKKVLAQLAAQFGFELVKAQH